MFASIRDPVGETVLVSLGLHTGLGTCSGSADAVLRNVTFPVSTCAADGSDMDLMSLCPELASARIARAALRQRVWTYAEIGGDEVRSLDQPIVWTGCGALAYFAPPRHQRNERGWVNVDGYPTPASLVELSWFTFVRDLWMRSHKVSLGGPGGRKITSPSCHDLFLPLMAQVRGWKTPEPALVQSLLAKARRWALNALAAGLEAAFSGYGGSAQDPWNSVLRGPARGA